MASELPSHHQALVLSEVGVPLTVQALPTSRATPGTVIASLQRQPGPIPLKSTEILKADTRCPYHLCLGVSLMGKVFSGVSFSYLDIVGKGLNIRGTWMCTREQAMRLIRMVETGTLPLGAKAGMGRVRSFRLEDAEKALDAAAKWKKPGEIIITP